MKCDHNNENIFYKNGCYVLGPTGPTGPQGPPGSPNTAVTVGVTKAGPPGTEPEVYSTGTENNIILNFVIPRGEPGPIPKIIIGKVETGEADTLAKVNITPLIENEEK